MKRFVRKNMSTFDYPLKYTIGFVNHGHYQLLCFSTFFFDHWQTYDSIKTKRAILVI